MKYRFLFSILCLPFMLAGQTTNYLSLVNPFIGSGGTGHTFPGAAAPHGMVQLSPDTRTEEWESCAGYQYLDDSILGFSHTHLSGTGVPDLCDILLAPIDEKTELKFYANRKPYVKLAMDKKSEKASPGYYHVNLPNVSNGVDVDLTCTERTGWHKYDFHNTGAKWLLDLQHRDKLQECTLEVRGNKIVGHRLSNGWASKQYIYFVMEFSVPISVEKIPNQPYSVFIRTKSISDQPIVVKVGLSGTSIEGAQKNLDAEGKGWNFDEIRTKVEEKWQNTLSKIDVQSSSISDKTNFYTAMYHVNLTPCIWGDVDSMYRALDGKVYKAKNFMPYTIFSLWDTYRAAHPLFTIIDKSRTLDYIKTFLDHYDKSGHLPVWELNGNETWCMIGYHAVSVIADAYAKGIRDFDTNKALEAMISFAESNRFGIKQYRENGFLSADDEGESVSKTLEYAYDDWCIAQFARALGRNDVMETFQKRAQSWLQLADPQTHFMRPRSRNRFIEPFDPTQINGHFTEGNSWQYSFYVPQDLDGFIKWQGGNKATENKLDLLFSSSMSLSGRIQPDVTGLIGQYAHGNEPSHQIAYMYNRVGAPWKTQEKTREILRKMYSNDPSEGLSGNEDCGQMSAWYILSSLGIYSLCPGVDYYDISTPIWDSYTISLENGKKWKVKCVGDVKSMPYISSVAMAGRPLDRSYLIHDEIASGIPIEFTLTDKPNKNLWNSREEIVPSDNMLAQISPMPFVKIGNRVFKESEQVELSTVDPAASIYFSWDAKTDKEKFAKYQTPIIVDRSDTLYFYSSKALPSAKKIQSIIGWSDFYQIGKNMNIKYITPYNDQYPANGELSLVDGLKGNNNYRNMAWQGFNTQDVTLILDLGEAKKVNKIDLGFIQDQGAWIFFPTNVEVSTSLDEKTFEGTQKVEISDAAIASPNAIKSIPIAINQSTRFIKIVAKSIGKLPDWHLNKGDVPWIFMDEITIK